MLEFAVWCGAGKKARVRVRVQHVYKQCITGIMSIPDKCRRARAPAVLPWTFTEQPYWGQAKI